jgi:hypothetical protein
MTINKKQRTANIGFYASGADEQIFQHRKQHWAAAGAKVSKNVL